MTARCDSTTSMLQREPIATSLDVADGNMGYRYIKRGAGQGNKVARYDVDKTAAVKCSYPFQGLAYPSRSAVVQPGNKVR